jgi:hypothetical protein
LFVVTVSIFKVLIVRLAKYVLPDLQFIEPFVTHYTLRL